MCCGFMFSFRVGLYKFGVHGYAYLFKLVKKTMVEYTINIDMNQKASNCS